VKKNRGSGRAAIGRPAAHGALVVPPLGWGPVADEADCRFSAGADRQRAWQLIFEAPWMVAGAGFTLGDTLEAVSRASAGGNPARRTETDGDEVMSDRQNTVPFREILRLRPIFGRRKLAGIIP
jgi:hypothetical protein